MSRIERDTNIKQYFQRKDVAVNYEIRRYLRGDLTLFDNKEHIFFIEVRGDKILISIREEMFKTTFNIRDDYEYDCDIIKCKCDKMEDRCRVEYMDGYDPTCENKHIKQCNLSTFGELKDLIDRLIKRYMDTAKFEATTKRDLWLKIFQLEKRIHKLEQLAGKHTV